MKNLINNIFYNFFYQKKKINLKFIWKNNINFKKINKNLIFNFFKIYYYIHNLQKNKNKSNIKRLTMVINYSIIWSNILIRVNKYDNIRVSMYNIYSILLNNLNILY